MSGMRSAATVTAGAALKCTACHSVLFQRNAIGEPIIRTRGIVKKQDGLVLICPKCKADVCAAPNFLLTLDTISLSANRGIPRR